MRIFVNIIMINVWLLNKKLNKSVKLPFSVLIYGGSFVLILNLNAFNCPYFIHFSYWLTSASKIHRQVKFFRQVFKTFIFLSVPRGSSLWVERNLISNFETCPSFRPYLILDKFPSFSVTDPSWSSNWIISVRNSNEGSVTKH